MRLKSINGAPFPEHLDFSEDTLLDGVNCVDYLTVEEHSTIGSTSDPIKWRRLAPKEARLRTGWSQPYLPRVGEGVLMAMPDMGLSTAVSEQEMTRLDTTLDLEEESSMADNDFLQHSLIFHDTLLSSQVAQDTTVDRTISSSSFLTTSAHFVPTGTAQDESDATALAPQCTTPQFNIPSNAYTQPPLCSYE
jgi:hypothetical protein